MTEPLPADPAERQRLIARSVREWTGELVDLGGRNTLLYYRDLKQGTLDVGPDSSARPAAVDELLSSKSVRLSELFDDEALASAARRARTVRAKAVENFEERGLGTLFLAWGMATWTNTSGAATPAAPVLLREAYLAPRGSAGEDFDVTLPGDWEVNPTLLHLFRTEYQISLDGTQLLTLLDEDADPPVAIALFQYMAKAGAEIGGFAVAPRVVIGNFSYAKLPMVLDLETATAALVASELICALAGDEAARAAVRARHPNLSLAEPDTVPPADEFLVLDADASQSYVINAAVGGADLVIDGPPGTGKSQTIANLIASLSARGQRILFVAEKRAAIEAVMDRLRRVGLGELVLDLHEGATSKRKLAADLARSLALAGALPRPDVDATHDALVRRRRALVDRVEALHAKRAPWGVSVYDAYARIPGVSEDVRSSWRLRGEPLSRFDVATFRQVREDLQRFVGLGGLNLTRETSPWADAFAANTVATPDDASAALAVISRLADHTLPETEERLARAAGESGASLPDTVAGWSDLAAALTKLAALLDLFALELFGEDLPDLAALAPAGKGAFASLAALVGNVDYRRARKIALAHWRRQKPRRAELFAGVTDALRFATSWRARSAVAPRPCSDLAGVAGSLAQLATEVNSLASGLGRSELLQSSIASLKDLLARLRADTQTIAKLPELTTLRRHLEASGLGQLLDEIRARNLTVDQAMSCLEYVWLSSILEAVSVADPRIGAFDGDAHRRVVEEYRSADHAHLESSSLRVRRAVAEHTTRARDEWPMESDIIVTQSKLKQRHLPVRQLFQAAPHVLGAIKPCWAMSPLVVSQLLPAERCFDVVIFDEASQVAPADAVGALFRAGRAIVAGDPHQLPPSPFFASTPAGDDGVDDDGAAQLLAGTKDMESVLDAMSALLPPPKGTKTLNWHYRSKDERLIAFSNAQPSLYGWSLTTFPGVAGGTCPEHVLVPFQPGRVGQDESVADEVARVVELVVEHAASRAEESLGVIAMGRKHGDRIDEALRRERLEDEQLDAFLSGAASAQAMKEPFFVKNLERVQGDERDAIILTIGYGKTTDGRMQYRFGPINNAGGERRLNVAITRARAHMTVVSSFAAADMDPNRLNSEGARMLARYLAYAESGGTDLGTVARDKPPLNPFERDVEAKLTRAGIPLVAQFGCSGYWIDYAAQHRTRPGQMVLAIECDGASYHSSETARDRDRLRQEHLERLGWRFHRIWSQDWFFHHEREIERAVAAYRAAVAAFDVGEAAYRAPAAVPAELDDPLDEETTDPGPGSSTTTGRDGPCPVLSGRGSIDEYSESEIVAVVRWVESDTLLRTEQELLTAVLHQLGFQKKGSKIVAAISAAIAAARDPRWKPARQWTPPPRRRSSQPRRRRRW